MSKVLVNGKWHNADVEVRLGGVPLRPIIHEQYVVRDRKTREPTQYTVTGRFVADVEGLRRLNEHIHCWIALDYAAALYVIEQLVLAGAEPVDAWDVAAWYCRVNNMSVTRIFKTLEHLWFDATGQMIASL